MLVVDAGVALTAARSVAALERLAVHDLLAPPLLWSEVHSALHEGLWRREIDAREAGEARITLDARLRRGADRTGLVVDPSELP